MREKLRDAASIPGLGRSPGGEHDNLLQYSCLENSKDRGAWWATVQGVSKSRTQLSDFHFPFFKKWTVRAKGESTPQELKVTPLVTDPTVVAGLEGDQ